MSLQISGFDRVSLLAPDYSSIPLTNLVRALSHISRFTGHAGGYSVAQHSVHVLGQVKFCLGLGSPEPLETESSVLRGALLHDLHEAVIGDISTPMKDTMAALGFDFREEIEARHMEQVSKRWDTNVTQVVHEADQLMSLIEADCFLGGRVGPWSELSAPELDLKCWAPEVSFSVFMRQANILGIE